jgi:3-oxoacyl-[acyl-carrier protein] reductase
MAETSRVALVTGASGGIGSAVALRLASDGAAVAVHYAGSATPADRVVAEIIARGGRAIAIKADIGDAAEVRALFTQTTARLGRLDIVVHCAGIMPLAKIEDGDLEQFDRVIRTNLRGSFIVLSEASKAIAEGGRIIAFSSGVVAKSFPGYGPYIASKAGVEGLVRVLADELRGRNVTVKAVAPGPVATPLFLAGKNAAQIEQVAKLAPLERPGQPEDMARVVSFLVAPDDGRVNGQALRAHGGFA